MSHLKLSTQEAKLQHDPKHLELLQFKRSTTPLFQHKPCEEVTSSQPPWTSTQGMRPQAVTEEAEEASHLGHRDQEEENRSEVSPECGSSLTAGNLLKGDQIQM